MRQVSLIIILSRLICHHRLREIRCELLLDWQSWLPSVPCSCNAHLCTIFKLPSWHCNPINPPPYTRTHVAAHTHIDVCMCRAVATVPCLHHALVRWLDPWTSMHHSCGFPFLELGPSTCIHLCQDHVLSCLEPWYSWQMLPMCSDSRHLPILKNSTLKNSVRGHMTYRYRCPYGLPIYSHRVKNTTSRFQCTFHQLTGLVTLSPELLNSRLNALREHRGW